MTKNLNQVKTYYQNKDNCFLTLMSIQLMDIVTTLYSMFYLNGIEQNPLMAILLYSDYKYFIAVKTVVILIFYTNKGLLTGMFWLLFIISFIPVINNLGYILYSLLM